MEGKSMDWIRCNGGPLEMVQVYQWVMFGGGAEVEKRESRTISGF